MLNALPYDIYLKIFGYLNGKSVINLSLTCNFIRQNLYDITVTQPKFWYNLCVSEIDDQYLIEFKQRKQSSYKEDNDYWEKVYRLYLCQENFKLLKLNSDVYVKSEINESENLIFDPITKCLIRDKYIITGHKSGCICQWKVDGNKNVTILIKHTSGEIRDLIFLNPVMENNGHTYPPIIVSIAQDNILKFCSTVVSPDTCADNFLSLTMKHPPGIHELSLLSSRGETHLPLPFMTNLCPVGHLNVPYFAVGFRSGFLSLWEFCYPPLIYSDNIDYDVDDEGRSKKFATNSPKAFMRSVLRAHDSEILHMAYWDGFLATASIRLELKIWKISLSSPFDMTTNSSTTPSGGSIKPRFSCYHTLTFGFHSYQQSLPFGGSFYLAPWNFAFKYNHIIAANLKLIAVVGINDNDDGKNVTKNEIVQSNNATPLTSSSTTGNQTPAIETEICYRQFRTASKLPMGLENESIQTLLCKGSLLCLATGNSWILVYHIGHTHRGATTASLKELLFMQDGPVFMRHLDMHSDTCEFRKNDIPSSLLTKYRATQITGLDLSFETTRIILTVTTELGVVVYKFEKRFCSF